MFVDSNMSKLTCMFHWVQFHAKNKLDDVYALKYKFQIIKMYRFWNEMCELQKVLNAKYVMLDQFCFGVLCDEIEV